MLGLQFGCDSPGDGERTVVAALAEHVVNSALTPLLPDRPTYAGDCPASARTSPGKEHTLLRELSPSSASRVLESPLLHQIRICVPVMWAQLSRRTRPMADE